MKLYTLLLVFVVFPSFAAEKWQVREDLLTKKVTLENGLEVFLTKNPKAPVVSIYHWVKAGSLHEKPGTTGIAHLFEHMMFRPLKGEKENFFDKIQPFGGSANANTRYMATVYTTSVSEMHLEQVLEFEADRFQNLKVSDALLDVERKAVWSEYSTKFDTSSVIDIWGKIYEVAFPAHPYEWTIIGYREDLNKIKAEHANAFYKKYYRPNNTGLFISGNIDMQKTLNTVKKLYGKWPKGKESSLPKEFNKKTKLKIAQGEVHSNSKQIIAGFRLFDEMQHAMEYRFLNHILFSSSNSLSTKRIKTNKKFVSSVSGFNYDYDSGMMKVFMISMLKNWHPLLKEILSLKEDFNKLNDIEFQAYKTEFMVSFKEGILRNESYNEELALSWGKMNDVGLFFSFEKNLKNLNKDQLSKLLDRFYFKDNLTVVRAKN